MVVGLDTNILCYSLDPAYPENQKVGNLLLDLSPDNRVSINPTILHEAYHVLVFSQKWVPLEARRRLQLLLQHPFIEFYNQTKSVCVVGLHLAVRYGLGGRDALILANFLVNRVTTMYTHDQVLISRGEISWKGKRLSFKDPLS